MNPTTSIRHFSSSMPSCSSVSPNSTQLVIQVIAARNLASKSQDGTSDPYVNLKFGSQSFKTHTVKRSLTPQWNKTFTWDVMNDAGTIELEIFHDAKSRISMGRVNIPLERYRDLPFQLANPVWLKLQGERPHARTLDIKEMKKAKKNSKKKAVPSPVTGEIQLRIGTNSKASEALTAALKPTSIRFEDYEKVTLDKVVEESVVTIDRSEKSTERSLRLVQQAQELGAATCVRLQEQGKALRSVDETIDQIDNDLEQGKRHLRGIESVGGALINSVTPGVKSKSSKKSKKKPSKVVAAPVASASPQAGGSSDAYGTRFMLKNGDFDHLPTDSRNGLSRIEDNLDAISAGVDVLSAMSKEMGTEIQDHNSFLDKLNPKVEKTRATTEKLSRRTRRQW